MASKVIKTKSGYKLLSDEEYQFKDKPLLKVKDTGNGLICKFPSWCFYEQAHYVELDYHQALYLKKLLNKIEEL